MIQANELRIGNWYNQFGNFHQVTPTVIESLSIAPETQLWFRPIPLTPDILEKCGFEKNPIVGQSKKYWYKLGELSYNESHEGWWFRGPFIDIQFLHQLQNLYFALTGTELTVNL